MRQISPMPLIQIHWMRPSALDTDASDGFGHRIHETPRRPRTSDAVTDDQLATSAKATHLGRRAPPPRRSVWGAGKGEGIGPSDHRRG
jgi:hypothetical protein